MAKEIFEKSILKTEGWNPETKVPIVQFDSVSEALSAGHYGSESDILHAANATRRVRMDRLTRDLLESRAEETAKAVAEGKEAPAPVTVEELRGLLDGYVYKQREPADPNKPKAQSAKKAVEAVKAKTAEVIAAAPMRFTAAQIEFLKSQGVM